VLILVFASHGPGSTARASIGLPIAFHVFSNLGWIYFAPSVTALLMTRAPEQTRGTFYGINAFSVTAGSLISGRIGGLYEKLPASEFWLIHAAIVGGAGLALLLLARPLGRRLPEIDADPIEPAPPPGAIPLPV
jgi:POT family proton-dependent oligopeptide transporter